MKENFNAVSIPIGMWLLRKNILNFQEYVSYKTDLEDPPPLPPPPHKTPCINQQILLTHSQNYINLNDHFTF